jgi:predicted outer membrane protein
MSASLRLKGGVLAAGLSCLVAGLAVAQQLQQAPGTQPRPGQPGQRDRFTTQPAQQGQQYTAEFRGTQTAGQAVGQEVERYLANCLAIKNHAEIEMTQFAQQQAQNPEVKQFAQQLAQDHRQLAQKLQQLPGVQAADRTPQTPGARGQLDAQQTPSATNQARTNNLATDRPGAQSGPLNELVSIDRQITERCMEMAREELQAKSGPEFDQCFLAAQIGNHMHMLAALEVIGQRSQGELKQVAQEAQPIIQRHLDQAKQLAKQVETSGDQSGAQAERQSGRTQR